MKSVRKKIHCGRPIYPMAPPYPFDGHGWAFQDPLFEQYIARIKPRIIIEVGTWYGASARHMVEVCKKVGLTDFEVVCIDTFLGATEAWTEPNDSTLFGMKFDNGRPINYEQFISNTIHMGMCDYITPFPIDSTNGARILKYHDVKADLVYIDAGHDYDSVCNDIQSYKGLLNPGGVLIGDDYRYPDVRRAANDSLTNILDYGDKFVWLA